MWKHLEGLGARPSSRSAMLALVSLAVVAGPATASQWNLAANASPSSVLLGQATTVTASVRNDGASTSGFIQILRRGGFQADLVLRNCETSDQTVALPGGGSTTTCSVTWTPAVAEDVGTFTISVGVFDATWTQFPGGWADNLATVTVTSTWELSATASPAQLTVSQTTHVTANVKNDGATLNGFIQIARRGGGQPDLVLQNCAITMPGGGAITTCAVDWTPDVASSSTDSFHIAVGVFDANWNNPAWQDNLATVTVTPTTVVDPGPRGGQPGAGGPLAGLNADEQGVFLDAKDIFAEVDSVSGGVSGEPGKGLGPAFNGNSCAACHAQPAVGGTSPHPTLGQVRRVNPETTFGSLDRQPGREQMTPSFIRPDGPVREARFIRNPDGSLDGGVHDLFTIAGRVDAPQSCQLAQPDFAAEQAKNNVIFRIPTPTFGLGLVENTTDQTLQANLASTASQRQALGIGGVFNTSGNDGTITRFGWKAQNKSLLIFAAEAYNVEQGVSNEGFPQERSASPECFANPTPEDHSHIRVDDSGSLTGKVTQMSGDTVNFGLFMRLLAPPTPTTATSSEVHGQNLFSSIGCALCHSPTLSTNPSIFTGQSNVTYHPHSDFALHHMGQKLADFVNQGVAGPDQFRTAPLWGVGQRIFFLHDGRAGPDNGGLFKAISEHFSVNPACAPNQGFTADGVACVSEANATIVNFDSLSDSDKQDILNFLRSL